MSREIKYQAWDKEEKRMSKVLLIDWINECVDLDEGVIERDFNQVELLEYIGRKDEDECEIYEEDIVQVIEQGHNMGFYYENEYVGIVKYDEEYCSFKLKLIKFVRGGELIPDEVDGIPISFEDEDEITDYWFSEWIVAEDMKILGNTFENPELLKGE
ncbi:YopX family protein [Marinilactibacillus psychrotolerans]|uniref:YopX family protein n=1 Tax=Marinilactibacillus psychrotolerans TaxID=191770 RepID=UPI00388647C6